MGAEIEVPRAIGGQSRGSRVDEALARLAALQHGVGARWQLERIGIGEDAIDHRLRTGRLHRLHRGVYAIGHTALSRHAHLLAAALRVGPDAVLSGRSAAELWRIRRRRPGPIHVSTPRRLPSPPGIRVHRAAHRGDELTTHEGIPVTTVPRTLLDSAAELSDQEFGWALNEAEVLRLTDRLTLPDLIDRYPGRRGVARARRVLHRHAGPRLTRSALEQRFLSFIDRHRLPAPATNARLLAGGETFECDFLWRRQRLVVELDGYAYHSTRRRFRHDRRRDRLLRVAGWETVRLTEEDLADEPALSADLLALLGLLDSGGAPA